MNKTNSSQNLPVWRKVIVQQDLPESLKPLEELSRNLWWSWDQEAIDLFAGIDPGLWKEVEENPIVLLDTIPYAKLVKIQKNQAFTDQMQSVYSRFREYMNTPPRAESPSITYFSMEFGLHNSLKIYSGGLGLLAGDFLKEASDYNYRMYGVGILYKYGYFQQVISSGGDQVAYDDTLDFSKLPVLPVRDDSGSWKTINVDMPGRKITARIWRADIGRVPLFLLDTDIDENQPEDRELTHKLYGGDEEHRLKQELLLGIGGIRALRAVGIDTDIYHCNEGHAAFTGLERLREFVLDRQLSYAEALEVVRASSLFTTHTPVPAGHDSFDEPMLKNYLNEFPGKLGISWPEFMNLGRYHADRADERFSMSVLAVNISQEVNGVSKLHGRVSQEMFSGMYNGYLTDEMHIGYVTNGVHVPTWLSGPWRKLYEEAFGPDFLQHQEDRSKWQRIMDVPDEKIWKIKSAARATLMNYIKDRLSDASARRLENPKQMVEISDSLNKDALTIGFARRFATYKRAHLLFRDLDRLAEIVNNEERPVQFVFAGKAHPKDKPGQELIKMIVGISKRPEFAGKVIFLQNYNIQLAKQLLHGVDIWLNTPTRPLEASGTSGEKAVMNGGIHFSVLDGWWAEGYREGAGFALPLERTFDNQEHQDELDSELIYSLLENEITPRFYSRNNEGVPGEWIGIIKKSIAEVAPEFTMNRMLRDYIDRFYSKLYARSIKLKENNYQSAKDISAYKKVVLEQWENIRVIELDIPHSGREEFKVGEKHTGSIKLDLNGLSPEQVGIEMLMVDSKTSSEHPKVMGTLDFQFTGREGSVAEFTIMQKIELSGEFDVGIRVYPVLADLPHRMDFPLVKWL